MPECILGCSGCGMLRGKVSWRVQEGFVTVSIDGGGSDMCALAIPEGWAGRLASLIAEAADGEEGSAWDEEMHVEFNDESGMLWISCGASSAGIDSMDSDRLAVWLREIAGESE